MKQLSEETILQIHDEQIELYGGSYGVRDMELFRSQCVAPFQTFFGEDLFVDIYDKAVRYLFGFATNQVFVDGNKRTATMVALVFLALNNVEIDIDEYELYGLTISVANAEVSKQEVKDFLILRTV